MRDEFEKVMCQKLSSIEGDYIDIVSGDVHRLVGGYPGRDHSMPVCCDVMRQRMNGDDFEVEGPLKGKGATLKIRYFRRNHKL